jgi:hypothetical protein
MLRLHYLVERTTLNKLSANLHRFLASAPSWWWCVQGEEAASALVEVSVVANDDLAYIIVDHRTKKGCMRAH